MRSSRREFLATSAACAAGLLVTPALGQSSKPKKNALRICFFTDAHLPGPNTHPDRLPNDRLHHQERVQHAFDKANSFQPHAFVFGGDNVFALDQDNTPENAHAQCDNWKKVVDKNVRVSHHSVIGNHDIWTSAPDDNRALARETFQMPANYYTWKMSDWKFVMLDVFTKQGGIDDQQWAWLEQELSKPEDKEPVCIVSHTPLMGLTITVDGGGVGGRDFRSFFYRFPQVKLALSGHNHMVDFCRIDRVTYICGGAVSAGWWEGDYQHFAPVFLIVDLFPDGKFESHEVYWELTNPHPHNAQLFPPEKHLDQDHRPKTEP